MEKVVLITGASFGIGKEFAYKYASNGYNLLLVARSEDKLFTIKNYLEKEYNIKVYTLVKDLSEKDSAKYVFNYTKENNIQVDILINNAGFGDFGNFVESSLEKQTNMIELNITTLVGLCNYFLKDMVKNKSGKILNVSSIAGFMPGPFMSNYYATKSFVLSFSEAIAEEVRPFNIKVSALCPGPTDTNFEKNASVKFSNVNMQSTKYVVNYAYEKFMNTNKIIILPGFSNKVLATTTKLLPRFIVRKAVATIQKKFRIK